MQAVPQSLVASSPRLHPQCVSLPCLSLHSRLSSLKVVNLFIQLTVWNMHKELDYRIWMPNQGEIPNQVHDVRTLRTIRSQVFCRASIDRSQSSSFAEFLKEEEVEKWYAAREPLLGLGFSVEEADTFLGKAFGWSHTPYWGEGKSKLLPDYENVCDILRFLRDLGLSDSDLSSVLKKYPEILGCRLEEELMANVGILDTTWGISGKTLQRLLLRNPKVLGYNVDCKGDCIAQCTRCWARF